MQDHSQDRSQDRAQHRVQDRASQRYRGAASLARHVEPLLATAFRSQGFADSAIHLAWDALVGADLAPHCEPVGLQWRRSVDAETTATGQARPGGVLTIKVTSAFALRLQYQQADLVRRINAHVGWTCIDSIRLLQGPVRKRSKPAPRAAPRLPEAAERMLADSVAPIEDPKLRDALLRLGRAIKARA